MVKVLEKNFFSLFKCVDLDGSRMESMNNLSLCEQDNYGQKTRIWQNAFMNFDNVIDAFLTLFEVSTFKGWIGVIDDAVDSRVSRKRKLMPKLLVTSISDFPGSWSTAHQGSEHLHVHLLRNFRSLWRLRLRERNSWHARSTHATFWFIVRNIGSRKNQVGKI